MSPARRAAPPTAAREVTIARIGPLGDGVADGPLYVPGALPGERVRIRPAARGRAALEAVLSPSPERVAAPCPHAALCGGCSLQHWADAPYAAWKRGLLAEALARAGFPDAPVAGLVRSPPGSRRRADLALRRRRGGVLVGLHARGSAEVVELSTCLLLAPALVALLAPLRAALAPLSCLVREGSAVLNLLDTGPDLLLRTDAPPTAADRAALAAFGAAHGIPRIAWALADGAPEIVAQQGPVRIAFAGAPVSPPPGAFLQATREGEAAIIAAVLAGLPGRVPGRRGLFDLYAGCGTLSLPLARHAPVRAFEGDAEAVSALSAAARAAMLPVAAARRDLARQPLLPAELREAAAVVLDPPFAGAPAQMPLLAQSGVPRIILVSCNPAALARDARPLREAGYKVLAATPIDQFPWSAHLESVVVFGQD
ncbi:MAG: class I SAM-dependent RNA methyltransferase [Acetobacteraceae bacterium]|nr:class I SAM-dependent RNA methyltransferase [Acetobacteraceae bacterium]